MSFVLHADGDLCMELEQRTAAILHGHNAADVFLVLASHLCNALECCPRHRRGRALYDFIAVVSDQTGISAVAVEPGDEDDLDDEIAATH